MEFISSEQQLLVTLSHELLATLQAKQEALFFQDALNLYIPPEVSSFIGSKESEAAADMVKEWEQNDKAPCLLLLGDSGAGKTLFGQWLTRHLFQKLKTKEGYGRLPLFIPLLTLYDPNKDLIDGYLKKFCGLKSEARIQVKQQPLLLILDGYDECTLKLIYSETISYGAIPILKY